MVRRLAVYIEPYTVYNSVDGTQVSRVYQTNTTQCIIVLMVHRLAVYNNQYTVYSVDGTQVSRGAAQVTI